MAKASEINDEATLRAWLEGRPQTDAVAIAHRAALRALPVWVAAMEEDWAKAQLTNTFVTLFPTFLGGVWLRLDWREPATLEDGRALRALRDFSAWVVTEQMGVALAATEPVLRPKGLSAGVGDAHFRRLDAIAGVSMTAFGACYAKWLRMDGPNDVISTTAEAVVRFKMWPALQRDAAALSEAADPNQQALWRLDAPDVVVAAERVMLALWSQAPETWDFWRRWWEGARDGKPLDWELQKRVALIPPEDWAKNDPAHIARLIRQIEADWQAEQQAKADQDLAEAFAAQEVIRAALGDFRFDTFEQVLRLVPFAEDIRFLRDPEALARFLDDSGALVSDASTFTRALAAEGGRQGAGSISVYLSEVVSEFARGRKTGELRVGRIVELGSDLQTMASDAGVRAELSHLARPLDRTLDNLLDLTRRHFADTLLRLAPLREVELEPGLDAHELLSQVRDGLRGLKGTSGGRSKQVAPADMAVLEDMANHIDRLLRKRYAAMDARDQASLQRDINFHMAQLQVTIALAVVRGREAAQTLTQIADAVLGFDKRVTGLGRLWAMIKPLLLRE